MEIPLGRTHPITPGCGGVCQYHVPLLSIYSQGIRGSECCPRTIDQERRKQDGRTVATRWRRKPRHSHAIQTKGPSSSPQSAVTADAMQETLSPDTTHLSGSKESVQQKREISVDWLISPPRCVGLGLDADHCIKVQSVSAEKPLKEKWSICTCGLLQLRSKKEMRDILSKSKIEISDATFEDIFKQATSSGTRTQDSCSLECFMRVREDYLRHCANLLSP